MKKTIHRLALPVALSALLLTSCAFPPKPPAPEVSDSAPSTPEQTPGSASAGEPRQDKDIQLVQKAFAIDLTGVTPEVQRDDNGLVHETYTVKGETVVIEWKDDKEIPDSLYYQASDKQPAKDTVTTLNSVSTAAQRFLSQVLGVDGAKPVNIYGIQNRLAVLMQAEDGSYWHVQFPATSTERPSGCQYLLSLEDAEQFYAAQNAKKLR